MIKQVLRQYEHCDLLPKGIVSHLIAQIEKAETAKPYSPRRIKLLESESIAYLKRAGVLLVVLIALVMSVSTVYAADTMTEKERQRILHRLRRARAGSLGY